MRAFVANLVEAAPRFVSELPSSRGRRRQAVVLGIAVEAAVLLPFAPLAPAESFGIPAAFALAVATAAAVLVGTLAGVAVALAGAVVFVTLVADLAPGGWAALGVWPVLTIAAGLFAERVAAYRHDVAERASLRRVVAAQELERRRLADALHDGTAQALASVLLRLRAAGAGAPDETQGLLVETLRDVRRLAVELHPRALEDFGLVPALRRLVEGFGERTGVDVRLEAALEEWLPAEVETAFFRIVQEALENVERHAVARRATVRIVRSGGTVAVAVEDDGRGFDPRLHRSGYGLDGMRARARLLGGRLEVDSREGAGTTVSAAVPLDGFPSGRSGQSPSHEQADAKDPALRQGSAAEGQAGERGRREDAAGGNERPREERGARQEDRRQVEPVSYPSAPAARSASIRASP